MTGVAIDDDTAAEAWRSAGQYLKRFFSATQKQKSRLVNKAPLADLQAAALHHPDPFARRECLFFLDHFANDASTAVFAEALQDARDLLAQGLDALAGESDGRRARLEELDSFYAWWQSRVPQLWDEWQQYKHTHPPEARR